MATVNGKECDVCGKFIRVTNGGAPGGLPDNWMKLEVSIATATRQEAKEICSNKCLKDLATDRWKAEGGGVKGRTKGSSRIYGKSDALTNEQREEVATLLDQGLTHEQLYQKFPAMTPQLLGKIKRDYGVE